MSRRVSLVKHLSKEELERSYRGEKNPRVKERLLAILSLYDGKKISEIPSLVRRSRSTLEEWLRRWNEHGYDGLIPNFTGGPKPWITSSEWDRVIGEIEDRGMSIKDATAYVKNTRGVSYSYKTVWEILRKKKPVIGFIDESSMQIFPNKRRVVNTRVVTYSEGTKRSKTIFGFMSLNGNDAVMVSDRAKSMDMERFIELVRTENRSAPIIAVMDNARIHVASSVMESASSLGMDQTFLPPYSPEQSNRVRMEGCEEGAKCVSRLRHDDRSKQRYSAKAIPREEEQLCQLLGSLFPMSRKLTE